MWGVGHIGYLICKHFFVWQFSSQINIGQIGCRGKWEDGQLTLTQIASYEVNFSF